MGYVHAAGGPMIGQGRDQMFGGGHGSLPMQGSSYDMKGDPMSSIEGKQAAM